MTKKIDIGWREFIENLNPVWRDKKVPGMRMVSHGGTLFQVGDIVVCEDPMYGGIHQTVSGEILDFSVDPSDKSRSLALIKRDDGFDDGGGPRGEWYARLDYCKILPSGWMSAEQTSQAEEEKGYVPDRLEQFCVTGPNGRLL